ncbi:glycosyltransferase family 2 protein [Pseudomonas sp. LRF_L74]|uniref:glycosyltransferase family 2 protein n=1 Tax=Pseudomonas sp. LRF_L74 TaxID=3369422 RepID=UPI003F6438A5
MLSSLPRAPVSVIIPCYCCSQTINRAVASVLNQTQLPSQIILVDDASPDEGRTISALDFLYEKYSNNIDIKIIHLTDNVGPGMARNHGWDFATEPYIAFLDADDAWLPQKIEVQYQVMAARPGSILSGHAHFVTTETESIPVQNTHVQVYLSPISRFRSLLSNPLATRTVMLRSSLQLRFAEGKRFSEDYLLWMQLILSKQQCFFIDKPLAVSFKHPYADSGQASKLWLMQRGELEVFRSLYAQELIGFCSYLFFSGFSVLKFLRRIFFSIMR